jgi:hypothetical protein
VVLTTRGECWERLSSGHGGYTCVGLSRFAGRALLYRGKVRGALVRGKCAGLGMERVSCGGSEPEALALHPFWVASRGRKRLFLGFFCASGKGVTSNGVRAVAD